MSTPSRVVVAMLLIGGTSGVCAQHPSGAGDPKGKARAFVELLARGEYAAAVQRFDRTMARVMPPKKLKEAWLSIIAQVGPYQSQLAIRQTKIKQHDVVLVTCQFKKAPLGIKVVLNEAGQVGGLWFMPVQTGKYEAPPYVRPEAFRDMDVTVGAAPWALPATLSVPLGSKPFPALVLVHGSGPNDRDETIGPNRPFRDLAWGLASRGIAVLRYEKRTKVYPKETAALGRVTVKQETIDDALAAVALLRKTRGIDVQRVFVLGHSLGGMLVPRIAARDAKIAGFIVMAGTTRPLEDVILDQLGYVFGLDGKISEAEKAQLAKVKAQVAKVKDPELSAELPKSELPLGIPGAYWLDLRGYDPAASAAKISKPFLVLQGGRDYQVTMADFNRWEKAFAGRTDVRMKVYPKLNHLMIEGSGKCTPADYLRPGHVAPRVIDDIAVWIRTGDLPPTR